MDWQGGGNAGSDGSDGKGDGKGDGKIMPSSANEEFVG